MIIECVTGGPFLTNGYLLADEEQNICCLIDCPHGTTSKIADFLTKWQFKLDAVYLTHSHFDHIGDLASVKKQFAPKIYIHECDINNVIHPGSDGIPLFMPTEGVHPDHLLKGGQELKVGQIKIQVIETPGHSPGSVSFFLPHERILFGGDVIFKCGRGRTDLPGCNEEDLQKTLHNLMELGDDVVVYPGHGETTTLGKERSLYL